GLIGVQGNGIQHQIGNGNLVAARTEGNTAGQNENQISKHRPWVLRLIALPSMIQTDQLRLSRFVYGASTQVVPST
nr:hypothetical protein [Tanacetum cinerariifolium]